MALPQDRYVKIISTNAGDPAITNRDLGALLFTKGADGWKESAGAFETGKMVVTHSLDQVAKYWKSDSKEYKFAARYFGYVSPSATSPVTLSFTKWGEDSEKPVEAFNRVNDATNNFGSFAFAESDITLAQVKDVAMANVGYNYRYLYSVSAGTEDKETEPAGTDSLSAVSAKQLAAFLGEMNGTCCTQGETIKAPAAFDISKAYKKGDRVSHTETSTTKYYTAKEDIAAGTWDASKWTEFTPFFDAPLTAAAMPMAIFGATNYDGVNTATYFMFKQFDGEAATVEDSATADELDNLNCNYNGLVQVNGQRRAFYQRGRNLDGENTAVYCNEIWLKARISTDIMNLFLGTERIPANEDGELMLYGVISSAAAQGIQNGVIERGKTLTNAQKTKIFQLTGDSEAWFTVQESGYTISVEIRQEGGEYKAYYKLIYSKGDAICYVEGSDILI